MVRTRSENASASFDNNRVHLGLKRTQNVYFRQSAPEQILQRLPARHSVEQRKTLIVC